MAVNSTVLQGRLVDVPTFGQTNSGVDYANFRLAWSRKIRDRENKLFLDCKAFAGTATFMKSYMNAKGQEIMVEGELNTDEWTSQEGQKRSKISLVVERVHFCGRRQEGEGSAPAASVQEQGGFSAVETDEMPF